jgi:hypothetical protein
MILQQALIGAVLRSLSAAGVPRLVSKHYSGLGGILAFHRLYQPEAGEFGSFSTSVAPHTFCRIVETLIEQGYTFLSMSGLVEWLSGSRTVDGKFVCLTFDDGFADTYTSAFPICREYGVPMTVYLVSGVIRRDFPMWSFGLEKAIAKTDRFVFRHDGRSMRLSCRTLKEKAAAYRVLASRLALASPAVVREFCDDVGSRYAIDFMKLSDRNALTPAMLGEMRASGAGRVWRS